MTKKRRRKNNQTKPYISLTTRKRRKKRIQIAAFLLVVLMSLAVMISLVMIHNKKKPKEDKVDVVKHESDIGLLFKQERYEEILDIANEHLKENIYHSYWLKIRGLASYQMAASLMDDPDAMDEKNALIDQCIEDLKRARVLKVDKDKEEIEILLGKALYVKGQYFIDSAIFHFNNALSMFEFGKSDMNSQKVEENIKSIYHYLGSCWSKMGDYQKSIEYFEKIDNQISSINQLHIAVSFYKEKNYIKAYEYLEEVIQNSGDKNLRVSCLNWKAQIYFEEGKYYKAINIYESLIKEFPYSPDPIYRVGMVYYEMNNKVKARDYFRKATQKEIKSPMANEALMTLY